MKKQIPKQEYQLPAATREEKIRSKQQVLEGQKEFLAKCIEYRELRQKMVTIARDRIRKTELEIKKLERSKK